MSEITISPVVRREAHYLDQYFGAWAMREDTLRAAFDRVAKIDLEAHLRDVRRASDPSEAIPTGGYEYDVIDGVGVLEISGTLMKQVSSLDDGMSTAMLRRSVRAMAADERVKAAILVIDSPGGTVAGTDELAQDVAALSAAKPTVAQIEDLGASAAYWIAIQAGKVYANRMALVGSIGVVAVAHDTSMKAAAEGVKVHVISSGGMKGSFTPGTELTHAQLEYWQGLVDATHREFVKAVASARRMSADAAEKVANGKVYPADEALKQRLIDGIQSFDQTMGDLRNQVSKSAGRSGTHTMSAESAEVATAPGDSVPETIGETDMSQPNPAPALTPATAATLGELKAACPGAPAEFVMEQLEKNATAAQAQAAFIEFQSAQIRAREQELEAAKKVPATEAVSVKPIPTASAGNIDGGSARERWDARMTELTGKGLSRERAAREIVVNNPDLYRAFLDEANTAA